MRFPNKETVEMIRSSYPTVCRVELVKMDDVQAPPIGTRGTVTGVDDTGSIMVKWDNGSGLNVVYGEDVAKRLDSVMVTCYGESELWDTRKEAADFYMQAIMACEGAERERYLNIYAGLYQGLTEVTDGEDERDD